jgi:hypothetical protein
LNAERDVRGQTVEAGEGSVEDHENEALVVPVPDAVVDPNAVVVHAQHASIAALAVVRAQRLELQARLAPVERERFGAFRLVVLEEVEDVVPPPSSSVVAALSVVISVTPPTAPRSLPLPLYPPRVPTLWYDALARESRKSGLAFESLYGRMTPLTDSPQ